MNKELYEIIEHNSVGGFLYDVCGSDESSNNCINSSVSLLNELFQFKKDYMNDEPILDVIHEYAYKKNINPIELAQELSELDGFQTIVALDCEKHGYSRSPKIDNCNDWN